MPGLISLDSAKTVPWNKVKKYQVLFCDQQNQSFCIQSNIKKELTRKKIKNK